MEALVPTPHGRIYVEREGDPSGRVVVLAGGGPGVGHDHYHPWFSRLATDASVVYFDYSGCGRSDRLDADREYSIALFAENIEAVRQQTERESIDLVGLSFGGLPAVEYALEHPRSVRRLVLSNAQISAESWQRTNIDGVNLELQRLFPEEWRQILRLREKGVRSLDPEYQALVPECCPISSGSTRGAIRRSKSRAKVASRSASTARSSARIRSGRSKGRSAVTTRCPVCKRFAPRRS